MTDPASGAILACPAASALDILIVNWNTGPYLRACLESIAGAACEGVTISRVVVADNASSDGSCEGLANLAIPLRLIRNSTNRGFAAACNQAAAGTTADYLLFLNPDTRLFDDSLSEPIAYMSHPGNTRVGICGIQLVDGQGRPVVSCARFPTPGMFLARALGLTALWPSAFKPQQVSPEEYEGCTEVDQVIGAYFLVRRPLFEAVGGFDERFFVYFEEVDLSARLRQQGYRSVLLKDVTAYHQGGISSEQVKAARLFYSLRSRVLFAFKHFSRAGALVVVATVLGPELFGRLARAIARVSLSEVGETLSAYRLLAVDLGRRVAVRLLGGSPAARA